MKATVFSHNEIIGTTDLVLGDQSMGHVYGIFVPNQLYFDHIQKHVFNFWKTSKPDYDQWHSLNINLGLEDGPILEPEGGINIADLPDEPIQIDIAGLDWKIIRDYFSAT